MFFFSFSNQGNKVLYIGMLRHCTVTAVKTNITPVSCPAGTVWRQDKSGEDRQGHVKPREDGCSVGCPGMTDLTFRSFVQNFTTVYLIFKHRDDISQKTVPPPPLQSSNQQMKLLLGPVMMAFCFTLFRTIPPAPAPPTLISLLLKSQLSFCV